MASRPRYQDTGPFPVAWREDEDAAVAVLCHQLAAQRYLLRILIYFIMIGTQSIMHLASLVASSIWLCSGFKVIQVSQEVAMPMCCVRMLWRSYDVRQDFSFCATSLSGSAQKSVCVQNIETTTKVDCSVSEANTHCVTTNCTS